MANNDFNPDLTRLDQTYQVLTELHGEGDSRTYVARHLRLNRDVTISVFRASSGDHRKALTQFASDVRLLTEARHPHIVPVIEGVWLDDTTFATVRARVRGATLDHLLSTSGPLPIDRVAATIRDISDAIVWARDAGVAQRDIAPWDIVFQQGSGRVLLSFEPGQTALATMRTPCDDAQTVRRLVIEMLAGEVDRSLSSQDIAVPQSIPSDVADALAAVRHCSARNATSSLNALLNALDASAARPPRNEKTQTGAVTGSVVISPTPVEDQRPGPDRVVPTVVQRSVDTSPGAIPVITSVPPYRRSAASQPNGPVVVRKPSFGFNARLATAIAVLAVVGAAGAIFWNRSSSSPTTVAVATRPDTGTSAAGEVALHPTQPTTVGPATVAPAPPVGSTTTDSSRTTDSVTAAARRKLTPPPRVAARPADSSSTVSTKPLPRDSSPARKKPVVLDSAAAAERQFQRDSAADAADPCLSADASDQHRCLMAAIEKNDHELNAVYTRLIAVLRREAGAASADPDPQAVNDLRDAQRKWVDARDAACRDVGEAPLYAKSRAACFAQKSADRVRELQRRLEAIPPT